MTLRIPLLLTTVLVMMCAVPMGNAADTGNARKVGFHPVMPASPAYAPSISQAKSVAHDPAEYVFAVPPRETAEVSQRIYQPIADYLSQVIGKKVVFRHPTDWLSYQAEMRRGDYDLVLDDSHFNGWRAAHLQHNILIRAPGQSEYVVIVRQDNVKVTTLKQLAGRSICAMSPPHLGTLSVLREFENPLRQPLIQSTQGWDTIYNHLQTGQCSAAILPRDNLLKYDPQGRSARVVHKTPSFPNQALSAGTRVSPQNQTRIALALTTPAARLAMAGLRDVYAIQGDFQAVNRADYLAMARLLQDSWDGH